MREGHVGSINRNIISNAKAQIIPILSSNAMDFGFWIDLK